MIVAVELTEESPAAGKMVQDVLLPGECVLAAVIHDEHILLPSGATKLRPGDTVIGVATPQDQVALRTALLGSAHPAGATRQTNGGAAR